MFVNIREGYRRIFYPPGKKNSAEPESMYYDSNESILTHYRQEMPFGN